MNKLFGTDHPFFHPLWRRIVITVFVAAWTAVEFANGNQFWGFVFGGLTAVAVWGFFIDFNPDGDQAEKRD